MTAWKKVHSHSGQLSKYIAYIYIYMFCLFGIWFPECLFQFVLHSFPTSPNGGRSLCFCCPKTQMSGSVWIIFEKDNRWHNGMPDHLQACLYNAACSTFHWLFMCVMLAMFVVMFDHFCCMQLWFPLRFACHFPHNCIFTCLFTLFYLPPLLEHHLWLFPVWPCAWNFLMPDNYR